MTMNTNEWEKQFEQKFSHEDDCKVRQFPGSSWECNCEKGQYKTFIRSLLTAHTTELKEKIEKLKVYDDPEKWHTGKCGICRNGTISEIIALLSPTLPDDKEKI